MISVFLKNKKKIPNDLSYYLKELEKEELKPKVSRREAIINQRGKKLGRD